MGSREEFFAAVDALPVIDTHEHLETEQDRNKAPLDFFHWFSHYASSDLISAGMPGADLDYCRGSENPLEERWNRFEHWWERTRNTAYCKALELAARDLFGVEEITRATVGTLSERLEATRQPGWYKVVMREKCNIRKAIFCGDHPHLDRELFTPVYHVDGLISPLGKQQLDWFGHQFEVSVHSLRDMLVLYDKVMERTAQGFCGYKLAIAYQRTLSFPRTNQEDAERVFNRLFQAPGNAISPLEALPLQNWLLHELLARIEATGKPLQVHTGLQEGNGNYITNSKASHLANLFADFPKLKFDIFHGSYPYMGELGTLAKNFPNVFIDMCWMHVISPYASRVALREWLETVPATKISAFGGDYIFIEGTYAHCKLAKADVAEVLWQRIEEGQDDEASALALARRLLFDNPRELFGLEVDGG